MNRNTRRGAPQGGTSPVLLRELATLYYKEDITQAEIAERFGMSRPGVSRLLAEARRRGIVRIEIDPLPIEPDDELTDNLRQGLGLNRVYLIEESPPEVLGSTLSSTLETALRAAGLKPGSIVVLSTGRTIYETITAHVPELPGVTVVPGVGGQGEPEAWYQANELTRHMAENCGGHPQFLYAPALPGPQLYETLLDDPVTSKVIDLWDRADCAILGIGAPPHLRSTIASDIPLRDPALNRAVGDVCLHFFDENGDSVTFPGSNRIVGAPLTALVRIPSAIALAVGEEKASSIIGAARGGYMNELITDAATARRILATLGVAVADPMEASS